MIKKFNDSQTVHTYEILDYILTPRNSSIDTGLYVDGTMAAELTMELGPTNTNTNTRIFSNNGIESYGPNGGDWGSPCTWGLQFESNGNSLAVAPYGISNAVPQPGKSFSQLSGVKLRYRFDTSGYLNIYNADDSSYLTWSTNSDPSYVPPQVTTLCFFNMNTVIDNAMYVDTKVYDMKVWQGGSLVRHYIPAKRLSDNVCGFYEEVNATFFPNMWNNSINPNLTEENFTGVSKQIPEYIDETTTSTSNINSIKVGSTNICRIYNGGQLYFGTPVTYTYELLDHLITPTESYIDTGINADETTIVEFVLINNQYDTSRSGRFFSTYDDSWWNSSGTWSAQFENTKIGMIPLGRPGYSVSNIQASSVNGVKLRFNVTATGYLNIYDMNDVLQYSFNVTSSSYTTRTNIRLMGVDRGSTGWSLCDGTQVFYYKIWKNNDLVRHYVPARRLSDDTVGLYDLVNDTFNENHARSSSDVFTGVSKATPEYI